MRTMRKLAMYRIFVATLTAAGAMAAGAIAVRHAPAPVAHSFPALSVGPAWAPGTVVATTTTPESITAVIDQPSAEDLLIAAEYEAGPNDPETDDPGRSYGTPDWWCVIEAGADSCSFEATFPIPGNFNTIRVFISEPGTYIDTYEAPRVALGFNDNGCIEDEPDSTVALNVVAVGPPGSPGAPGQPAPNPEPDPMTCESHPIPTSSASPSGTASPSDTGTPTETGTASPTATTTPSSSATPSPSPSAEPLVLGSPFEGRYREHRCHTYLPANAQAPCEAAGESFAASGLTHAIARVRPADGEPATMAQADASAGVIQSVSVATSRIIVVRFRVHEAVVESAPSSPTLGAPYGGVELWLHVESPCGIASSMMTLPIDGSGSIDNQVVEVRVDYGGCDSLTSIQAGIRTAASTMPGASGAVHAEATASIERITVL